DFTAHPLWAYPHVDRYFVASELVADQLVGYGVARERIEVSGIPVDPRFAQPHGREVVRARFGFSQDRPLVLGMGGGGGVGPMAELADRLATLPEAPQVMVLCGTNARLRRQIDMLAGVHGGRLRSMAFTSHVDLLLEACDMVVSKAGGLTCAEALVKH